jgi:hypothetical protein
MLVHYNDTFLTTNNTEVCLLWWILTFLFPHNSRIILHKRANVVCSSSKQTLTLCGMELGCIGNKCFIITLYKVGAATEIFVQLEGTIFQSCQLNQCHLFHGVRYYIFPQQFCFFMKSIQLHHGPY